MKTRQQYAIEAAMKKRGTTPKKDGIPQLAKCLCCGTRPRLAPHDVCGVCMRQIQANPQWWVQIKEAQAIDAVGYTPVSGQGELF